jgi:hypothetical protein
MSTGPVEYLVIAFPDGVVNGDIGPELADLVNKETIRILDLVFVRKGPTAEITTFEFDEFDALPELVETDAEVGGLISGEDIEFVAADLAPGTAAAVLLVEDLWAASLSRVLDRSGALLVEGARIPRDMVDAAFAAL